MHRKYHRSVLHPKGMIKLVRKSLDDKKKLCYVFSFQRDNRFISFAEDGYKLTTSFGNANIDEAGIVSCDRDYTCAVLVYERG